MKLQDVLSTFTLKYVFKSTNGMHWVIDPMQKHTEYDPHYICECIGLIPFFIHDTEDIINSALDQYGFGGSPSINSQIVDGVMKYPNDPDLYPYALTYSEKSDTIVFVYPFGWVGFYSRKTGTSVVYRFD